MMKRMGAKNLKWMAGLAAVLMLVLTIPITPLAEGHGGRYSGMDPILTIDGHKVNIRVEFPDDHECEIYDEIDVVVHVPAGTDVELLDESRADFVHCDVETSTRVVEDLNPRHGEFSVDAFVPALGKFPVKLKVLVNGEMLRSGKGVSNRWVQTRPIQEKEITLSGLAEDETDVLIGEDELVYSYDVTETKDAGRVTWMQRLFGR